MRGPTPTATYRFQLTPTFGFDRAAAQLDRLQRLGISHVYLSPVTEAVPGSTHGYDVVDHARVRDELGGLDGLTALLDACAGRGMGVVIDHVPNHTAVGRPELNARWWAMLRDGSGQRRGALVRRRLGGRRRAGHPPGARRAAGRRRRRPHDRRTASCASVAQRWPLAARHRGGDRRRRPLARQHYRLQWWRTPERNVRRFFTIDDLVGVRVEDPAVAAVVDTVPRLLVEHPAFAGVRVDHVDGLADPLGYLDDLRALIGDRWLLVEKILAAGRDAAARRGRSTGRRATSTPPSLEHALLDRGRLGRSCATAGRRSPATTGRSGRGSCRRGARCSTAGCGRTSSASPAPAAAPTSTPVAELTRAPRALPHLPARRGGPAGARRCARRGGRGPSRPGGVDRAARRRPRHAGASGAPAGSS